MRCAFLSFSCLQEGWREGKLKAVFFKILTINKKSYADRSQVASTKK